MQISRFSLAIASIVVVLASLAGCGGGSDSGTTTANAKAGGSTAEAGKSETTNGEAKSGEATNGEAKSGGNASGGGASGSGNVPKGSQNASSKPKPPVVKKADAICAQNGVKIQAAVEKVLVESGRVNGLKKDSTPETIVNDAMAPGVEAEIEDLQKLEASTGSDAGLTAVVKALEEALEKAQEDPKTAVLGSSPFVASEKVGEQYGFSHCGGLQ